MSDTKKPYQPTPKLADVIADLPADIAGGEEVSLDNIEAMPVTPETEEAFKDAQKKKAEAENEDSGNGGYG